MIFDTINRFFAFIEPLSDAVWDFPRQFSFYTNIPLLGQLSLAVILLLGIGIYFTLRTGVVQLLSFRVALPVLLRRSEHDTGISALAAFMLGLAMRAGPGNIVGVTGAITVGGPGALFWMWVAALFGMATAFTESVLAQLFKEKKQHDFVGGLPFYGERVLGNHRWVGLFLSLAFIIYALFNVPAQTFNVFTAVGMIADTATGVASDRQSPVYYGIAALLVFSCAWLILGGIRRVTRYTNILVPIKAAVFCGISLLIIVANFPLIPDFFTAVFKGAVAPDALFGGAMGVALAEGVRRGLMSNEAGQGTITMAAAAADNQHPCEQGFVQGLGVFFDTLIICTLTGFIVVLAHVWSGTDSSAQWTELSASRIGIYMDSVQALLPGKLQAAVVIILSACYALFAFTTLLGMISFAEISANFISRSSTFITGIRILGSLVFVPFGALTVLAGLELGNLWAITDLTNIIMVYLNIPILLLGAPLVYGALAHYRQTQGAAFASDKVLGIKTVCWMDKP